MKTKAHKKSSVPKVRGRKRKARSKIVDKPVRLTKPMEEALLTFIEYHPPARVSRVLRRMLVQWLMSDSAVEERDFQDIMYDVEGLFGLLDAVDAQ